MLGSVDGKNRTDTTASATPTPAELLKQAVSRPAVAPAIPSTDRPRTRLDLRLLSVAATALAIGAGIGVVAVPGDRSGDGLTQVQAALDTSHAETARLGAEIERTSRGLAALREAAEAARSEAARQAGTITERIARSEQGTAAKVAALGERVEQAQRDHGVRLAALAAQIEKRSSAPSTATAPSPAPTAAAKPEPTQTGSIVEPKATKPETIENWAVRDVYDGVAMLEDRKHRLAEVTRGDTIPGVGRVEAVERRGRTWVVVTKQGLITPQTW